MSSSEYRTIFDGASALVEAQLGNLPGTSDLLASLRERCDTNDRDPRINRRLIVEPQLESQILCIPVQTVQKVVKELHKLNVLHLWARATCPNESSGDDATVVETNNVSEFRAAVGDSCPHCGQSHEDIGWDDIESFYALNFDVAPDTFRFGDYFRPPAKLPDTTESPPSIASRLSGWCLSFFSKRDASPSERVVKALAENRSAILLPTPIQLCQMLWQKALLLVLAGVITSVLIGATTSPNYGILTASVFVIVFLVLTYVTLRTMWAASAIERRIAVGGNLLAFALLARASGVGFSLTAGEHKPWDMHVELRDADRSIVIAAVVVFAITQFAIVVLQSRTGRQPAGT